MMSDQKLSYGRTKIPQSRPLKVKCTSDLVGIVGKYLAARASRSSEYFLPKCISLSRENR